MSENAPVMLTFAEETALAFATFNGVDAEGVTAKLFADRHRALEDVFVYTAKRCGDVVAIVFVDDDSRCDFVGERHAAIARLTSEIMSDQRDHAAARSPAENARHVAEHGAIVARLEHRDPGAVSVCYAVRCKAILPFAYSPKAKA